MNRRELEEAIVHACEIVGQDKLARNEQKDRNFVRALSDEHLINARLLRNRLDEIGDPRLEPA